EPVAGPLPGRTRRCCEREGARDSGSGDETKARWIKLEKSAQPGRAQRAIARVVTHRAFVVVANLDGQSFGDSRGGHLEVGSQKLTHVGPAPAVVHPI